MKKFLLTLSVANIFVCCSTQKNSFKNRQYHKMVAWFNGIFNAEELLKKQKTELLSGYNENYSKILPIGIEYYSALDSLNTNSGNNNLDNNKVETPIGFQAIEFKARKAIGNHSMKIKGREVNNIIVRAYLLIGKSLFYQKKYFEALDPLNYVINNFKNTKYAEEANIYKTISEIEGGNYFDGIENLEKLYESDLYKDRELKVIIARSYAQSLINQKKYEESIGPLQKAVTLSKNKEEKARLLFVMGQIFSRLGKQQEAGEAFTKVYKMNPGTEMEIKSQLAISANFDPKINNYTNYKNHLLNILKKGIYNSKKNEFYYGISDMAYRAGKLDEAIKYAKLSLKEPISDPDIRGKVYENFGDIKFNQSDYVVASAYYDSAQTSYKNKEDQGKIELRNKGLKKLMEKHYLVKKNDSILKLANLSADEQNKYFLNFIDNLKKKEEKLIEKEKIQMENFRFESKGANFSNGFNNADGSKFYFYNQGLKYYGKQEFTRVWGDVKLKDNWRNSNAIDTTIEDKLDQLKGQIGAGNPRRFEIDYYLDQIPSSKDEINNLKIERDTTQLSLGIGYFDIFNNRELAVKELTQLIDSPPKSEEVKLKAIYQLYRIYRNRDQKLENKYKNEIINNYPNTIYAGYILNPEVEFSTPESKEAIEAYKTAYELYKGKKYAEVKSKVKEAFVKFPTQPIVAKFSLLNAYAIKETEGIDKFKQALDIIVSSYNGTEEAKKAMKLLESLKKRDDEDQNDNKKQEDNTKLEDNVNKIDNSRVDDEGFER